jgi:1,4-alpha-glucan branching enzyme
MVRAALLALCVTALALADSPAQSARAPIDSAWRRDGVCYEVFVRSFFDSDGDGIGDLNGLTAKLDYINDGNPRSTRSLGAKCIWLMPIASSPSYHGYDDTDYYRVERDYGTASSRKPSTPISSSQKRPMRSASFRTAGVS